MTPHHRPRSPDSVPATAVAGDPAPSATRSTGAAGRAARVDRRSRWPASTSSAASTRAAGPAAHRADRAPDPGAARAVALQEVQEDQHRWLRKRLPGYRIWPGTRYGTQGIRLQIAWRRRRFDLRDRGTLTTTFSDQRRPIPWVRLATRRPAAVLRDRRPQLARRPGGRPRRGHAQADRSLPAAARPRARW